MEAAHIPWRPLGRLLVEQSLLTAEELEHALAEQQRTGRRLGETIVALGFVSGPQLANALAAQYGIELTTENGFGTGLRSEIQRRHEHDRRRTLLPVPEPGRDEPPAAHPEPAEPAPPEGEALLLAQLEEQWAKLAAAEHELEELRQANHELRVQLDDLGREPSHAPTEPAPDPVSAHLAFVQLPGGYELVERDGPPPPPRSSLLLPELGEFVVAGTRRSPLPGDARPCVVVLPSGG